MKKEENRKVEALIADHVADAMAIEYIAMERWQNEHPASNPGKWFDENVEIREHFLLMAKRKVLRWLNREQGTDYRVED